MKHIVVNPNSKTVEIVEPLDMSQMLALVEDEYIDSELAGEYELIVGDSSLFNRSFHLTTLTVGGRHVGPLCGPIIIVPNTDRQINDTEIIALAEELKKSACFMERQGKPQFEMAQYADDETVEDDDFFEDEDFPEDDVGPT